MKCVGCRRKIRVSLRRYVAALTAATCFSLFVLGRRPIEPDKPAMDRMDSWLYRYRDRDWPPPPPPNCATVEEMGQVSVSPVFTLHSLRVRTLIQNHFHLHGAARVRELPPEQFCRQGFVIGKASEAGFGNEMYKILTSAALSVILNRSLIIGKTRGRYPFEDYISYTNLSFTLREVKHLWRKNDCEGKYERHLVIRTDDFEKPAETNVLCSDWSEWKQPIIWFQGTTDAVAIQFFLKNIHPRMRTAVSALFGDPGSLQLRPNVFGELMHFVIAPSPPVEEAVNSVLNGVDPDVALHMRMLMNRSVRAVQAAVNCIKRALQTFQHHDAKPRLVVISDSPSFIKAIASNITEFVQVVHFEYKSYKGNLSRGIIQKLLDFRVKDWGPAPRWVAFVDFFLASRAKHAVISGAHKRVGTTYAQLIAALAAAQHLDGTSTALDFSFFSSFQNNLLVEGLRNQVGWGHVWNRFAGELSCHHQPNQCARTPLLPSAWWDAPWQSPISRDIRRLQAYGVIMDSGKVNDSHLRTFCQLRKEIVKTMPVYH